MAFDVFYARIFLKTEGVYAVVFRLAFAGIVYAAARDYHHVRALSDEEVVVHRVLKISHREYDGDVHALVLHSGRDDDVYAGVVRLADDLNVVRRIEGESFAVFPYIEAAFRHGVQLRYLFQKFTIYLFHIHSFVA